MEYGFSVRSSGGMGRADETSNIRFIHMTDGGFGTNTLQNFKCHITILGVGTMADRLVEIECKDLVKLKNLYTPDGSKCYITYTTIDNYIRWFEQDPNLKHVKIYCLNGDFSDGTFVVTERWSAYADTFDANSDKLARLLKLLDYSKGYKFLSIRSELRHVIRNALQQANVNVVMENTTLLYFLPKEEALKLHVESPEGIELKPVTVSSDLEKINSVWPHRNLNSLTLFQSMATFNMNVGAYSEDGVLMAWIFRRQTGLLSSLRTDEKYTRKGYGSLVVRYLSEKIAESGHEVYASILKNNTPSQSLFEKHGFKSIGEVHWITTEITWSPADE